VPASFLGEQAVKRITATENKSELFPEINFCIVITVLVNTKSFASKKFLKKALISLVGKKPADCHFEISKSACHFLL
jgi:hypothetical protein